MKDQLVEELETPLKKFFSYMKENSYWIGNDLVEKYRELVEEEKKFISELRKIKHDKNRI